MRALVIAAVLATTTPALADLGPMYVRATTAQVEVAAPRLQRPPRGPHHVVLRLAMREPVEEERELDTTETPRLPTLMEQLRDVVVEALPVVSTAVVTPLPIASADGTLVGAGVLGKF